MACQTDILDYVFSEWSYRDRTRLLVGSDWMALGDPLGAGYDETDVEAFVLSPEDAAVFDYQVMEGVTS